MIKYDKKKKTFGTSHVLGKVLNFHGRGHSISKSWVMDSGATHHMNPSRDSFASLYSTYTSNIEVGDSSHISMKGKGEITFGDGHILICFGS